MLVWLLVLVLIAGAVYAAVRARYEYSAGQSVSLETDLRPKLWRYYSPANAPRPDGLMEHDVYLVQVKKPGESKKPWDYYKILKTIPGKDAFKPLSESTCPLVKK